MGKNYISLEKGEKKYGMKFNMGTLRRLKELTNDDPFSFFVGGDIGEQIKQVATIMYAALLSNCASKKEEPDFKYEDVLQWADELDMPDMLGIVTAFRDAYRSDAPQEGGEDTRAKAADLAVAS